MVQHRKNIGEGLEKLALIDMDEASVILTLLTPSVSFAVASPWQDLLPWPVGIES
jgi:hypothetical protein